MKARVHSVVLTLLAGRDFDRDEVREVLEILIKPGEGIGVR